MTKEEKVLKVKGLMNDLDDLKDKGADFLDEVRDFISSLRKVDRDLADSVYRGWFASLDMVMNSEHDWLARRDSMDDTRDELIDLLDEVENGEDGDDDES
jgi:hypothetical protein